MKSPIENHRGVIRRSRSLPFFEEIDIRIGQADDVIVFQTSDQYGADDRLFRMTLGIPIPGKKIDLQIFLQKTAFINDQLKTHVIQQRARRFNARAADLPVAGIQKKFSRRFYDRERSFRGYFHELHLSLLPGPRCRVRRNGIVDPSFIFFMLFRCYKQITGYRTVHTPTFNVVLNKLLFDDKIARELYELMPSAALGTVREELIQDLEALPGDREGFTFLHSFQPYKVHLSRENSRNHHKPRAEPR